MPSYRVTMVLGTLHVGVDPASVLPEAMAAARTRTAVESGHVEVVRDLPRVVVRFEAADDLVASGIGQVVVARTDELVVVETSRVTRRVGGRWLPLR